MHAHELICFKASNQKTSEDKTNVIYAHDDVSTFVLSSDVFWFDALKQKRKKEQPTAF